VVTVWLVAIALSASGFALTRMPNAGAQAAVVAAWVIAALLGGVRLAGVPVTRRA
jgi:hypothetical protein